MQKDAVLRQATSNNESARFARALLCAYAAIKKCAYYEGVLINLTLQYVVKLPFFRM